MSLKSKNKLYLWEIALFPLLGGIMLVSKFIMDALPNIHLLGMLTATYTVVFRKKALIPIYIYVFLNGFFSGFATWWLPYIYIWTILWGAFMLLPKKMPKRVCAVVYPIVCSLHGFLFGTLYAPAQALIYGLNFKGTIAWIVAGFPFDAIQGVSNLLLGTLILPCTMAVNKAINRFNR